MSSTSRHNGRHRQGHRFVARLTAAFPPLSLAVLIVATQTQPCLPGTSGRPDLTWHLVALALAAQMLGYHLTEKWLATRVAGFGSRRHRVRWRYWAAIIPLVMIGYYLWLSAVHPPVLLVAVLTGMVVGALSLIVESRLRARIRRHSMVLDGLVPGPRRKGGLLAALGACGPYWPLLPSALVTVALACIVFASSHATTTGEETAWCVDRALSARANATTREAPSAAEHVGRELRTLCGWRGKAAATSAPHNPTAVEWRWHLFPEARTYPLDARVKQHWSVLIGMLAEDITRDGSPDQGYAQAFVHPEADHNITLAGKRRRRRSELMLLRKDLESGRRCGQDGSPSAPAPQPWLDLPEIQPVFVGLGHTKSGVASAALAPVASSLRWAAFVLGNDEPATLRSTEGVSLRALAAASLVKRMHPDAEALSTLANDKARLAAYACVPAPTNPTLRAFSCRLAGVGSPAEHRAALLSSLSPGPSGTTAGIAETKQDNKIADLVDWARQVAGNASNSSYRLAASWQDGNVVPGHAVPLPFAREQGAGHHEDADRYSWHVSLQALGKELEAAPRSSGRFEVLDITQQGQAVVVELRIAALVALEGKTARLSRGALKTRSELMFWQPNPGSRARRRVVPATRSDTNDRWQDCVDKRRTWRRAPPCVDGDQPCVAGQPRVYVGSVISFDLRSREGTSFSGPQAVKLPSIGVIAASTRLAWPDQGEPVELVRLRAPTAALGTSRIAGWTELEEACRAAAGAFPDRIRSAGVGSVWARLASLGCIALPELFEEREIDVFQDGRRIVLRGMPESKVYGHYLKETMTFVQEPRTDVAAAQVVFVLPAPAGEIAQACTTYAASAGLPRVRRSAHFVVEPNVEHLQLDDAKPSRRWGGQIGGRTP
jgi:hypothetical protein